MENLFRLVRASIATDELTFYKGHERSSYGNCFFSNLCERFLKTCFDYSYLKTWPPNLESLSLFKINVTRVFIWLNYATFKSDGKCRINKANE